MTNKAKTYQAENHLHASERRWFAIYTKYKAEKYVQEVLAKKRINAYVPLVAYSKRYGRKIKSYEVPLINCYVFVCINKEEYVKVLETNYVHGFLKIRNNLISIPKGEIEVLRKIVGEESDIVAEPSEWLDGIDVEILSGNLTGLRGKLVSKKQQQLFQVELKTIGYSLMIDIDPKLLTPIKNGVLL